MAVIPSDAHPHSYARLFALMSNLTPRGFTCSIDESGSTLLVLAPNASGPRAAIDVVCKPRQEDGGNLWYWTSYGKPLANGEDVVGAAVALVGILESARFTPVSGPLGGINV